LRKTGHFYFALTHNDGANAGFADGHAKWYQLNALDNEELWDRD